jgi:hypothetical protein
MTEDEAMAFAAGWAKAWNDHDVELLGARYGVNTIVIRFRAQDGTERAEVLSFSGGLARIGHGTYAAGT